MIGSGPGGALLARRLAESGRSVIIAEAGPVVRPSDMGKEAGEMLARYFWEAGLRQAAGNLVMPTLQAKCLGGGSLVNSAICLRIPNFALARWQKLHGVRLGPDDLLPHFEEVERYMNVRPADPSIQGRRNELFRIAAEAVGFTPEPTMRNEDGCRGSGACLTGCTHQAKQSVDIRGVPDVMKRGGRVYTSVAIERLIIENGRIRGAVGHVRDPETGKAKHPVRLTARCTVLAAGALATPVILQKSGIKHRPVGANLQFHPGSAVMGVYDEDVSPWEGATQGYHCLDFLNEGIKLESLWAAPSLLSFRFPGLGREFKDHLRSYKNMAIWDVWVSGEDSVGSVRTLPGTNRPQITYRMAAPDVERMQIGMARLAEMHFAAGAKRVLHGAHGLPPVLTEAREVADLRRRPIKATDLIVASNHVFGSTSMGADPTRHVVDEWGAVYGAQDLYVCDTGIFPYTPAVNPMLTIMAFADRFGIRLADTYA